MKTILFAALLSLGAAAVRADVYVIANPATAVSPDDVVDIFTGEKQLAGSVKLVPMDNAAVQDEFLAKALHLNVARYNAVWTKKAFREGLGARPVRSGDAEVARIVRSTPGAVGYVSAPVDGVKLVQRYR